MEPASTINVALTAIQNECLVLETLDDHEVIHWPLKNLTQPVKVGHQMTLELKNTAGREHPASASSGAAFQHPAATSPVSNSHSMLATLPIREPSEEYVKQARLCKMLEELVN